MPYAGAYNRLGTDPEDLFPTPCSLSGSDELTCASASYQYFNTDNWVLRYEGESWEITGASPGPLIARGGSGGYPPDMEDWDLFIPPKSTKGFLHVRIVCAE